MLSHPNVRKPVKQHGCKRYIALPPLSRHFRRIFCLSEFEAILSIIFANSNPSCEVHCSSESDKLVVVPLLPKANFTHWRLSIRGLRSIHSPYSRLPAAHGLFLHDAYRRAD